MDPDQQRALGFGLDLPDGSLLDSPPQPDPGPMLSPLPGPAPGDPSNPLLRDFPPDDGPKLYPGGDPPPDRPPGYDEQAVADADHAVVWDVASAVPGIGSAVSLVSTAIDAGKGLADLKNGQNDAARRDFSDCTLDAAGMIPGVGTLLGIGEAAVDLNAANDRENGASAKDAPTAGDLFFKLMTGDFKNAGE